jgi:murein DD-endopeptidase MepM/ murein hydrolase activator NlpD
VSWGRQSRTGISWLVSRLWSTRALPQLRSAVPATVLLAIALLGPLLAGFAAGSNGASDGGISLIRSGLRTELVNLGDRKSRLDAAAIDTLVQHARSLAFNWGEAAASLQSRYDRLTSTPSILPAAGFLSSAFSRSRWHPILDRARAHQGVDIAAHMGTPVLAAAFGHVQRVGYFGQYGMMIEISHGNGYVTRYAHLSRADVVVGQRAPRGMKIGEVGETGLAIGPHLHYEVLLNGVPRNPLRYLHGTPD